MFSLLSVTGAGAGLRSLLAVMERQKKKSNGDNKQQLAEAHSGLKQGEQEKTFVGVGLLCHAETGSWCKKVSFFFRNVLLTFKTISPELKTKKKIVLRLQ